MRPSDEVLAKQIEEDLIYLNNKFSGVEIKFLYKSSEDNWKNKVDSYWDSKIIIVKVKEIDIELTWRNRPKFEFEVILNKNKNFPNMETLYSYNNILKCKEDVEKFLIPILNPGLGKINYLNDLIQYKLTQGSKWQN